MTATSRPVTQCQVCDSADLTSVLYLGALPPVNTMPEIGSVPVEEMAYPLELLRCGECTLVQIGLEVDPVVLFPPSYPYRSRSTRVLRDNFADLRVESTDLLSLTPDDFILDIGSNDGTLLENFVDAGHRVLGVEPSDAATDAIKRGVPTLNEFFTSALAKRIREEHGPVGLVTAANVFAHMPDPRALVDGIAQLLGRDGVFVSESHYLLGLVRTLQYDTVYHEHLRYYSVGSLTRLLEMEGLEVFHVKEIPTHGGSIRVYAAPAGTRKIQPSVQRVLDEEEGDGISDGSALASFRSDVQQSKLDLYELLAPLKRSGARIYAIGAPSRASTLINYVGLDEGVLDCVLEISSSAKLNKYMPGTRLPVLDEAKLFDDQPEYALLLSWHITDELVANLRGKGYRGAFISPLPTPRVIDG